jgi:hypothetical protein
MVRVQKLYSKFATIESGSSVTEVTRGSCCGRTDRWRQMAAIGNTEACAAHSRKRYSRSDQSLEMLTGGRWILDFFGYSGARGRRPAAPRPGQRTQIDDCVPDLLSRFWLVFSVRQQVYGELRSGFALLLPLFLPPRHGRLLH